VHLQPRILRRSAAAIMAAALVVAMAEPAHAAAPANDTIGGAVAIAALPFSTTLDTTQATTEPGDAEANPPDCGAPATDASVWYDLTLPEAGAVLVDVSASDYSAGVLVVAGNPGAFQFVTCGPGAVAFDVTPGLTYHMMVIDDQQDGSGNGGNLVMTVDSAPPPPDLTVTVDKTGAFNPADGSATVHGTAVCKGLVDFAFTEPELVQRVGRGVVAGIADVDLVCDGTVHPWSVSMLPQLGTKFAGGKAASLTFSVACGPIFCREDYQEFVVQLKRQG
jgi:hypothetical protein